MYMTDIPSQALDYSKDLQVLQDATDKINEPAKKTEAEQKLTTLRQEIAAQKTATEIRSSIDSLKKELAIPSSPSIENSPSNNDISLKLKGLETEMRGPLSPAKLVRILKEIPPESVDPTGRSFIVQYVVMKLQSDGFIVAISKNEGVLVRTENEAMKPKAAILQETLQSHSKSGSINHRDIEQSLIIGSGSLSEYRDTQANPQNLSSYGYLDFLMKKHGLSINGGVTAEQVIARQDIPVNEKALLASALSGGIPNNSLTPTLTNYDAMQSQTKELLDSKAFRAMEAGLCKLSGSESSPVDSKKVVENPSILSGKPITTVAAGLALVMGLGYEGKGKGFSLWTGLKRGFMALIALFLGAGVAKEWGIEPKKLFEEGAKALKEGGKKAGELAEGVVPGATSALKPNDKQPEVETNDTQKQFRERIMKDAPLSTRIDTFAADQKKYKKEQTGKLDDYVTFIETDLKDVPLSKIFATNHIESVFYDGPETNLPTKNILGNKMLKTVLRAYLMGSNYETLTGSGDTMGKKEQEEFLKNHGISDTDIATKKLSDILPLIQKKRTS